MQKENLGRILEFQGKNKYGLEAKYIWFCFWLTDGLILGFSTLFHGGPKEVPKHILKGQMNTTFWAFPIYFYVFQRWSKGQTTLVGRRDLALRPPVENSWFNIIPDQSTSFGPNKHYLEMVWFGLFLTVRTCLVVINLGPVSFTLGSGHSPPKSPPCMKLQENKGSTVHRGTVQYRMFCEFNFKACVVCWVSS